MSLFAAGVLANISARNPEPGDWVLPGARRRALKARQPPHGRRAAHHRRGRRPAARPEAAAADDEVPMPDDRAVAGAGRGRRDGRPPLSRASRSRRRCGRRPAARPFSSAPRAVSRRRLVPAAGFPLELVTVSGLKRMGLRRPAARAGAAAGRVHRIGAHPAPPPARRRAGRGRLRVGAAGVRGGAARLPDGDPGAEQPAGIHQPHAGPVRAARVHGVRRRGRALRRAARSASSAIRCAGVPRPRRRRRAATRRRARDRDPGRQPGLARGQRAGVGRWSACSTRAGASALIHQTGPDQLDRDAGQLRGAGLRGTRRGARVHRRHARRAGPGGRLRRARRAR